MRENLQKTLRPLKESVKFLQEALAETSIRSERQLIYQKLSILHSTIASIMELLDVGPPVQSDPRLEIKNPMPKNVERKEMNSPLPDPKNVVHADIAWVVDYLKTSESTYYRHIRDRLLKPILILGRRRYYCKREVEALAMRRLESGKDFGDIEPSDDHH